MKKFITRILVVMCSLLGVGMTTARAADITFNVNMHYRIAQGQFTAGTDQVVVLGSFSGSGIALTDPDGDKIYTGTVTGQGADNQITYNYRFTHAGNTINESVAARKYVVQPTTAANVLTDWFNEQQPPYPYAKFFASSIKTIPGEVVRFTDSSEGGAATGWNWTFQGANPSTSSAQNPTATWSTPGTYAVNMTATNGNGSTTARTLTVTVTSVDNALGWWNDAVFYQIYPRSFFDTNGNGFGDIQGMISKLDYLNDGNAATTSDLGVTALYIMPVHNASEPWYGGYQVTDYKSVIGEIGNQADFDQFVAAAHQRGMKVIMDMVFNHTSDEHPWFKSAATGAGGKYDDYYVFRATNPGSAWRNNTIGHSNPNFNTYWGKYGVKTPDLNFNSRSVRNTVKDISSFWLSKNIDGFRLDAPMFLYESGDATSDAQQESLPATYAYWQEWRNHIKAANPNVFSVGETWLLGKLPAAAKYVYQGFDVGFQFDIAYGLQDALNSENKSSLQTPIEQSMEYYPFLQFGVFASNHDLYIAPNYKALRLKSRLNNNQDAKSKIAAAWLLTAPGVPFVYYGDEVGGGGNNNYARDPMRWNNGTHGGFTTGNPWEPAGDYANYNVQSQQGDPNSFLSLYKQLIAIRKAEVSLRRGGYKSVGTSSNGVYAYMRTYGSEVTFVILNLAASAQNNVSLSVNGTSIPNGTFGLTNLMNAAQTTNAVTVSGGNISGWVPFGTLQGNAFAILKLKTGSTPPPPTGAVTVYKDCNYGGYAVALPMGDYTLGQLQAKGILNDDISSLKVSTGYEVQLFQDDNFQGRSVLVSGDNSCLTGLNFNDLASSLKVRAAGTPPGNTPPTVSLTAPSSGATYQAPASITLTANAADANGTVSKVEFYNGSTLLGTDTSAPYTYTWTGVAAGTYAITAKATDNAGASTTTAAVSVTVNAAPAGAKTYYIVNRWKGTYLFDNNQQVAYAAAPNGPASQWMLEAIGPNQRIKNVATGRYMNVEAQLAYVQSTPIPDYFTSGQWVLEPYAGFTRIRNVWKGTYVHVEAQTGTAQYGTVDATFYSGHWTLQPVAAARATAGTTSTSAAGSTLAIYPNPVSHGSVTVVLPTSAATARLRVLDGQGRLVLDRKAQVVGGQVKLDLTKLPIGLYLVQAKAGSATYTGKVAIE